MLHIFSQYYIFLVDLNCDLESINLCSSKVSLAKLAPLEAVLFEVDGTLCDSDPLHHHALSQMLQEIGYNGGVPITEEFFVEDFAGKSDADMAKFLFPNHLPRRMKFCDDKEAIFRR